MSSMSTPHEIRDAADLAIVYLQQDRTFGCLKQIMQAMHPWVICRFERDDESDACRMTFTDRGHEINFSSDGCGSFYVKKAGETTWAAEVINWDPIPIHEIISIITLIKSRLSDQTA